MITSFLEVYFDGRMQKMENKFNVIVIDSKIFTFFLLHLNKL